MFNSGWCFVFLGGKKEKRKEERTNYHCGKGWFPGGWTSLAGCAVDRSY
jgi:hypothetical protein